MSAEAPKPQEGADPISTARGVFNKELLGREYTPNTLVGRLVELQNTLLGSNLGPDKVYTELHLVAGQAADRAEAFDDATTTATLRNMQKGYELTRDIFVPNIERAARPVEPTRTERLPMSSGKGLQAPQQ